MMFSLKCGLGLMENLAAILTFHSVMRSSQALSSYQACHAINIIWIVIGPGSCLIEYLNIHISSA